MDFSFFIFFIFYFFETGFLSNFGESVLELALVEPAWPRTHRGFCFWVKAIILDYATMKRVCSLILLSFFPLCAFIVLFTVLHEGIVKKHILYTKHIGFCFWVKTISGLLADSIYQDVKIFRGQMLQRRWSFFKGEQKLQSFLYSVTTWVTV